MAVSIKQVALDVRRFTLNDVHLFNWAAPVGAALVRSGAGTVRWLAALMHSVQVSRVEKILHEMNDHQLDAIGIKRSDINAYAKSLMTEKSGES